MLQHTKCRQIGTSCGVIIPSNLLKSAKIDINDELDIDYIQSDDVIIIKKSSIKHRNGWDKAFKQLHAANGDELLIDDVFEDEFIDESI